MLNEIIKGISMALNTAFGEGHEIYDNDVKQGLSPGSFLILTLQPALAPLLGGRGLKTNPFDIHYFPATTKVHTECNTVAETMMDALRFITLLNGDKLHGTGIRYEVQDDVLHFFVSYNHTRMVTETVDNMETLTVETGTKEGRSYVEQTAENPGPGDGSDGSEEPGESEPGEDAGGL